MSAAPSEPEKFSIEEMLERLEGDNSSQPLAGELVTRADGTQAIRVKKRKRRSEQPQKEAIRQKQFLRNFQIVAVIVMIFALSILVGGAVIYSNSKPFRDGLIAKITEATGASVELRQFRINPKTANAATVSLSWPPGNLIKSLLLNKLQANVSPTSFLGRSFTGEEITAAEGTLEIQLPTVNSPLFKSSNAISQKAIAFNRYRIPHFSVTVGDPADPIIQLTKSEVSLNPVSIGKRPQLSFYKGQLTMAGWPNLRLDRALFELQGKEVKIIGLKILGETDNRGEFHLAGTFSPYKSSHLSTLSVTLNSFELSAILEPSLGRFISGRVDTLPSSKSNFFSFVPDQSSSPILDITFQADPSSTIELEKIPFLFALSRILEDPWFEKPTFEADASGIIHRENGTTTLKNLNLESKARMAIRGTISANSEQSISGTLQLGLAEGIIHSSSSTRLTKLFGPVKDGFRWLDLSLSGSVGALNDNFSDLFTALQNDVAEDPGKKNTAPPSFRELTK
jgi:hypothetical protein